MDQIQGAVGDLDTLLGDVIDELAQFGNEDVDGRLVHQDPESRGEMRFGTVQ